MSVNCFGLALMQPKESITLGRGLEPIKVAVSYVADLFIEQTALLCEVTAHVMYSVSNTRI